MDKALPIGECVRLPFLFFRSLLVFFSGRLTAAQMALGFIFLQNTADLLKKTAVDVL